MRNARHEEKHALGYAIVRCELFDDDGVLVLRCYEVACPRTAAVLGREQSLSAARRFIVTHELQAGASRSPPGSDLRAAAGGA